ncbi:MAG: SulP family inorganic anion transporter, partial [Chromatiaceae bacterium]|nr:SulP family inorganic anion transporter [Chromatiaceae bacterium]
MSSDTAASPVGQTIRLARFAPGLVSLLGYRRTDLPHDLIAGLSVAAVALPVGVAYAQLAGFNPVVGLYASILPLSGDPQLYVSLSVALTLLAGLYCIGASFLRLGALADFLSRPILVGYLNGIALYIVAGQLGKLFGFPVVAHGILPKVFEVVTRIGQTHWPTLAVGVGTYA